MCKAEAPSGACRRFYGEVMVEIDENNLENALRKTKAVCRVCRVFFMACFAICAFVWITIIGVGIFQFASGERLISDSGLIYGFLYDLACLIMFLALIRLFSEAIKESRPFSAAQANRLRLIALLALGLVLLELVFTAGFSYVALPEVGYGIAINDGTSEPTVNLNVGMLVFSGIMYSLSAIFRYAALLQQLSDDTV